MKARNLVLSVSLLLSAADCLAASPSHGVPAPGATMRKVVLEKATTGYHWKIEQAPVPAIGEHEVLVRVHAVSLNRGDLNRLEPDSDGRRTGEVPVTDAAGEVVAIGRQVKDVRKGERVTSAYFKNWVDGPFSHERLDHVPGWTADGVLADYIVLGSTDAIPIPDGMTYEEASTLPTAGVTALGCGRRAAMTCTVATSSWCRGQVAFRHVRIAIRGCKRCASDRDQQLGREIGSRASPSGARDGINYKGCARLGAAGIANSRKGPRCRSGR